mmetsp:Transcript_18319/g.27753  ORF Transcript_18319/g.27753 Transcript_18319/m.27753 type:complete len:136 (+) Transcript_18319:85-492(+)|eukprot:CAMPEP_0196143526 /NCGR_PEP_ID=MMETSP0910-20130528/13561_1 /TAXON_ID=49265 /ORGANISM="Thalassiosira rotula, Strain GSO102" /LENGTH=135 /DNA_ID=CAMNT_0041404999 /DNA_START=65 /DNA_END=472 /DNA_ORIENTATION=-
MMKNLWLALCTLTIANPIAVDAFGVGGHTRSLFTSSSRIGMSSPGEWENDDFLSSLGGGGGGDDAANEGYYDQSGGSDVERVVPENTMTDEEITMMAMRSAQFYNTDTSMEEAYGMPRQGPPRKQEEEEESGDFQ